MTYEYAKKVVKYWNKYHFKGRIKTQEVEEAEQILMFGENYTTSADDKKTRRKIYMREYRRKKKPKK